MKKLLPFLMLFILIGCSKNDCETPNIEGVYYSEDSQLTDWTFQFTNKHFISYSQGVQQSSIKYRFECEQICFDGICSFYEYTGDTLNFESTNYSFIRQ